VSVSKGGYGENRFEYYSSQGLPSIGGGMSTAKVWALEHPFKQITTEPKMYPSRIFSPIDAQTMTSVGTKPQKCYT
jgi:hypothetical protein